MDLNEWALEVEKVKCQGHRPASQIILSNCNEDN